MVGKRPLTRLTFPHHLNHWRERNASGQDTDREVARVLHAGPGVVAIAVFPSNWPANGNTRRQVKAYVFNNCHLVDVQVSYEIGHNVLIGIWGDCQPGAPDLIP
jgi:hypothetical protein